MKRVFLILGSLLLLVSHVRAGEVDSLSRWVSHIRGFSHLYPQEKVYLHCDNTAYFQGDTIWFAAYVTSAATLRPDTCLSKVLYVELLNEAGEVVSTQRLPVEAGHAHGRIPLCDEFDPRFNNEKGTNRRSYYPINPRTRNYVRPLPAGYYEVRAYTRAMLNWGTDICFSRVFPVFDKPEHEGDYTRLTMESRKRIHHNNRPKMEEKRALSVDFYPEGGHLVCGLPNRVAFKVTDGKGRELAPRCTLLADGKPLLAADVVHEGMGRFSFLPQPGVDYRLVVETSKGKHSFDLPDVEHQGIAMRAYADEGDSIRIVAAATESFGNTSLGLSITCRGQFYHFQRISTLTECPTTVLTLSKKELPAGVNQATLFDSEGRIFAERLFFVHDTAVVGNPSVIYRFDKEQYKPFEKINLTINTHPHKEGWGGSLSVRDGGAEIGTPYRDNLQTFLLLTSDLKGYIHRPDYYFEADDSVHHVALDLLMMTQGWRRYAWRQLAGVEPFNVSQPLERGLTIVGQVKHKRKKAVVLPGREVGISVSDGKKQLQWGNMLTDEQGTFAFSLEPFVGKKSLAISVRDKKNGAEVSRILIHRHFSPSPRGIHSSELEILAVPQPRKQEETFSFAGANVLQEATIHRNRRDLLPFTLYDLKSEREKAHDLGQEFDGNLTAEGYLSGTWGDFIWPPLWGFRAYDNAEERNKAEEEGRELLKTYMTGDFVNETRLKAVDYIQVYESPNAHRLIHWIGETASRLSFYDKKCQTIILFAYDRRREIPGHRRTYIDGYSYVEEYYHPQYNREIIPGEVDYRRTLYWNPRLSLDEKGEALVTFYNNGVCEMPVVSYEGLGK